MCQFIETIKCQEGYLINLRYHQSRFNLTRHVHFRPCKEINLEEFITIPEPFKTGLFKCRIIYSQSVEQVEFLPHKYRPVSSLQLVESNEIDYRYKYTARQTLEQLFEQRMECDDILIVKNGYISDSTISNVVFFDGKKWLTPDTPLLPGTQRARLIYEKKIHVRPITPDDLQKFQKAGLINALQDLEIMPVIDINRISYL